MRERRVCLDRLRPRELHGLLDVREKDCVRLAFGFVVLARYALDRLVPDQL
jgi:hypothetical protein